MWYEDGGAYEMTPDSATLTRRYVENQQNFLEAAKTCGLAGGIYTQITDVEHEVNGLFTYDRAVEKMDFGQCAQSTTRSSPKPTAPAPDRSTRRGRQG